MLIKILFLEKIFCRVKDSVNIILPSENQRTFNKLKLLTPQNLVRMLIFSAVETNAFNEKLSVILNIRTNSLKVSSNLLVVSHANHLIFFFRLFLKLLLDSMS